MARAPKTVAPTRIDAHRRRDKHGYIPSEQIGRFVLIHEREPNTWLNLRIA